jgi:hypothetical protein
VKNLLHLIGMVGSIQVINGQALINLDFELANVPPTGLNEYGSFVSFSDAFPGWSGVAGDANLPNAFYNNYTAGSAYIDILGPGWDASKGIIEGGYTAVLQTGNSPSGPVNSSLFQNGMIPETSRSIIIKVIGVDFGISFGGENVPLFQLQTGPNYGLFGGDITRFAGLVGELRVSAFSTPKNPGHAVYVDSIQFSPEVVPEPSVSTLLFGGCGVLSVLLIRKRLNGPLDLPA